MDMYHRSSIAKEYRFQFVGHWHQCSTLLHEQATMFSYVLAIAPK